MRERTRCSELVRQYARGLEFRFQAPFTLTVRANKFVGDYRVGPILNQLRLKPSHVKMARRADGSP